LCKKSVVAISLLHFPTSFHSLILAEKNPIDSIESDHLALGINHINGLLMVY